MRLSSPALAALPALCLCLLLSSCYETTQGLRYLAIRSRAVGIDRALADPKTSSELRLLLQRAQGARSFALENLGLKKTRNFTSVVKLDADRLATVVQACEELSFTRHLWAYPAVGKLPYRGYFDPRDAEKEAAVLRGRGLDVIVRPVDAFSTLGALADPLFSFMSSYGEGDIADLVIHEMTHATIFLKGRGAGTGGESDTSQFNEELATFVGREGSLLYLARVHGEDSREVAEARAGYEDAAAFAAWLAGTAAELQAVYDSAAGDDEKRRRKAGIIAARALAYGNEYSDLFKGEGYRSFPMDRINNASLDLYRLYEGESALYRDFRDRVCGGDLRRFIETVARIAGDARGRRDPKAEMRLGLAGS